MRGSEDLASRRSSCSVRLSRNQQMSSFSHMFMLRNEVCPCNFCHHLPTSVGKDATNDFEAIHPEDVLEEHAADKCIGSLAPSSKL